MFRRRAFPQPVLLLCITQDSKSSSRPLQGGIFSAFGRSLARREPGRGRSLVVQCWDPCDCAFYLSLGLTSYEHTTEDGRTYEFDVIPWLSEDGSSNTLTVTTSRYFGLSKRLLEPGNEQKLADALALLEYVSTQEGQEALAAQAADPQLYTAPLAGSSVPEGSPFAEHSELVEQGHTVQLVYTGWEELIVPMAQDIRRMVAGEIDAEGLLAAFDETREKVAAEGPDAVAVLEGDLTWDETLELCAIAVGSAGNADCGLVSRGGYNELREVNERGVAWFAFAGPLGVEEVNVFRTKCYTVSVVEMTGAEIKALVEAGFDRHGSGCAYPYTLAVKGGGELQDDVVYRLAAGTTELPEELQARAVCELDISSQDVMLDYLSTLGTFGPEGIVWE